MVAPVSSPRADAFRSHLPVAQHDRVRLCHLAQAFDVRRQQTRRGETPCPSHAKPPDASPMSSGRVQITAVVPDISAALAWGAMSSLGLLLGVIGGSFSRLPHRAIAMAMSVGAGLLLAGASLKVAADAVRMAGPMAAALSLLLGAAAFSATNAFLARFGAAHRKRCGECVRQPTESEQPGSGVAIALGNALDAVPEAMVLGIALRDQVFPLALVFAFSVGNVPEALSSAAGMRIAGRSSSYIFLSWGAIAIGAAVAIAAGYVGFGSLGEAWPPRLQAFGAGALLAMTAETMIPEAFHNSPRFSGLLAAFGFGLLLLVDATTR
jgi:zinc transporter, ZIP family